MRTFEEPGISIAEPVKVLVEDDGLELPDNLGELRVFYFFVKDSSGTRRVYQEGDSIVCFAKEEDARQKNPDPENFWSARLEFLVLSCQQKRMKQLVVR